jgi:hypothetical protein
MPTTRRMCKWPSALARAPLPAPVWSVLTATTALTTRYNHILEWSEASVAAKDLKVEGGAKRAKQRAAKGSSECAPSFVTASATERATEHATEHATESAAERATWSAQYWYGGGADRRDAEAAEVSDSPMDAQVSFSTQKALVSQLHRLCRNTVLCQGAFIAATNPLLTTAARSD